METKANYVLIGLFALFGLVGSFLFLIWLAKIDVDQRFSYYEVQFDSVSGLGMAGDVRYNGLPVGQVVGLELDEDDPSKVRVRIEVNAETPIKTDTVAQLNSQGVTGVSFVALSGGSPEAPRLPANGLIPSERSALQTIFEGAPELLEEAIALLEDVRSVVSEENKAAVTDLLGNLANASARLDRTLEDFEGLSADLGLAAREIAGFTGTLEQLSATAETTLEEATDTLVSIRGAADRTQGTLESAQTSFDTANALIEDELKDFIERGAAAAAAVDGIIATLEPSALEAFQSAQGLLSERLPQLISRLEQTATEFETQASDLGAQAGQLMARYEAVGGEVEARLQQSEATIESLRTASDSAAAALESVRVTSDTANTVMVEEVTPLAQTATAALEEARDLAGERLPKLIDNANEALDVIETEAVQVGDAATEMANVATARLEEAKVTLTMVNDTLTGFDETLTSISGAANSVTELAQGDVVAMISDAADAAASAREALETINTSVQAELPGVMADIRSAAEGANEAIAVIQAETAQTGEELGALTGEGRAAIEAATTAFRNANGTLEAINGAMAAAETTLTTADKTFATANDILESDVDQIVADVRGAVEVFSGAVDTVAGNLEIASGEVREVSQSANSLVGTVDRIVTSNERQVSDFLRVGLPQLLRFVEESRYLVNNLERLVDRVERDPARFLLGTQGSEFRR